MSKILIIQLSRLGDMVQTLPLLKRLKEFNADCRISLVCLEELSDIIMESTLIDRFIYLTAEEVQRLLNKAQVSPTSIDNKITAIPALRENYDLIINLTHNLCGSRICEIVKGERKSGGSNTYEKEIRFLGDWAKYLIAFSQYRSENLFNLVDIYIGMGGITNLPTHNYLITPEDMQDNANRLLATEGFKRAGKLIAFQMGANKLDRAWPVENFAYLADRLMKDLNVEILLLGSEKERELSDRFSHLCNSTFIDLTGKTTIPELAAVLRQCDLLVSNDTGTVHIAAAVNTKVLGIYFSSAYFTETGPYGEGNVILQSELACSPCHENEICNEIKCKDYITVEAVKKTLEEMLEGGNGFQGFDFENLSVYKSRFLGNGTLAYIPVTSSPISEQYKTGFLNRIMWESFLGIEHDPVFIEELSLKIGKAGEINQKIIEYEKGLHVLKDHYLLGIKTAQKIIKEFKKSPINQANILSMANELGRIETDISKLDSVPHILRDFHTMEMIDMGYLQFPQLAASHSDKYKKLLSVTETFLSTLTDIILNPRKS